MKAIEIERERKKEERKNQHIIVREYCMGNTYYRVALPYGEVDFAESILFQHFYPAIDNSLLEFVSSSFGMGEEFEPDFEVTESGHKVWRAEK